MGKFSGIFRTVSKVFKGILGVFSPKIPKLPAPVSLPAPKAKAIEKTSGKAADDAANRLRIAEKRKRGRRASILSDVDEEEAKLATVNRPQAGRTASVLLGS